jgi:hypothetical protein
MAARNGGPRRYGPSCAGKPPEAGHPPARQRGRSTTSSPKRRADLRRPTGRPRSLELRSLRSPDRFLERDVARRVRRVPGAVLLHHAVRRLVSRRPAPRHDHARTRRRRCLRRSDHRRQRGPARRQGGARRRVAQRVAAARRRARAGDLHRGCDEPDQSPARHRRDGVACAHVRLPARIDDREHLHPRGRCHRAPRDEHARGDGATFEAEPEASLAA